MVDASGVKQRVGRFGTFPKAKEFAQTAGVPPLVERLRGIQRKSVANKRCADCTERGPTYVCISFQTFVCQICSGIHREFGHKIKSISLSQWTEDEILGLDAGGNELAAKSWLASWNPADCPEPDNTDLDRVREFIRHKYEDKRWWKERTEASPSPQQAVPVEAPASAWTADFGGGNIPAAGSATNTATLTSTAAAATTTTVNAATVSTGLFDLDPPVVAAAPAAVVGAAPSPWASSTEPLTAVSGNTNVPANAGSGGGLLDVDFSCGAPPVARSAATGGGLMDLDFGHVAISPPTANTPAPAPTASDTNGVDPKAAVLAVADQVARDAAAPPLADRLRQAVLSGGSSDEVAKLFQQITLSTPQRQPGQVPLGGGGVGATNGIFPAVGASNSTNIATQRSGALHTPVEAQSGGGWGGGGQGGFTGAAGGCSGGGGYAQQVTSPGSTQAFYIGDDESPQGRGLPSQNASFPHSAGMPGVSAGMPSLLGLGGSQPSMPGGLGGGGLTPEQLAKLNPQELVQMQAMISQALQGRSNAGAGTAFPNLNAMPNGAAALAAVAPNNQQPKQFDDLLDAFRASYR
eukprot:TRINITY_DN1661_c1_g1_i1.p1 TRINITY_DN1661_c1_g1~~TRINITY_DN1661_c1_g1_i1.p1  ORF type:complete len:619 (+),score=85.54 TRINITY_DN1661_c1_g1_i1:126-1859(+)